MEIFNVINDLSNVKRWSQAHCNRPESVLEHTAFVSMFALSLSIKHNANIDSVLKRCLIHDIDETITGDIPNPTKYSSPEITTCLDVLAKSAAADVFDKAFHGELLYEWSNAKDNTLEGQIVAISDAASVVYKIWQELKSGNIEFTRYIKNVLFALNNLQIDIYLLPDVKELIDFAENLEKKT